MTNAMVTAHTALHERARASEREREQEGGRCVHRYRYR